VPVALVLTTIRRAEYAELLGMYFLQGAALAMWTVPLSPVLEAHGYAGLRPYAFATSALAAFVSPLLFGAMADRHASPVKVLRWLAFASAVGAVFASTAIQHRATPGLVLGLIQVYAFCAAPSWSIASTIVFARLADPKREFGPIRSMATIGWMGGCLLVSALSADQSTISGYGAAGVWLAVSGVTFLLPAMAVPKLVERLTWSQRFGYDALALLRERDHRVVFLTTMLFSISVAGFYPYAPTHLRELGLERTSAWMSLAQLTEVPAMIWLGALLMRYRLKWIFAAGVAVAVVRFASSAFDTSWGLMINIVLHGCSYTLVMITAQIYLDQRVDPAWRGRAQALMSLLNSGIGNLVGYLGVGVWFATCTPSGDTRWPWFWGGMALATAAVLAFFLAVYRGRGAGLLRAKSES
jgi:MFS family permease